MMLSRRASLAGSVPGDPSIAGEVRPTLVGNDQVVPLVTGASARYVNLDYAASTPPMTAVARAVDEFLPWYSSVHRGAGYKSRVSTAAYESARQSVHAFVKAPTEAAVIFTRNTTDAINLLASSLPEETDVLAFASEHHANMLPWRRGNARIRYLPMPATPADALTLLEDGLKGLRAPSRLVSVTGASNVTGELWPIQQIILLAHRHEARVLIDAAQLAPHMPIDMQALGADYVALSGHKMYAPYGAGALIGRADWLGAAPPFLFGGGAVDFVTLDEVLWAALPDRQEAGSPNVLGALALGVACDTLSAFGMGRVAAEELELAAYARGVLARLPGLCQYALWPATDASRLGIIPFNLAGFRHSHLAAILSAEYGVGVRHGCFCAHPLMVRLISVDDAEAARLRHSLAGGHKGGIPGAVRVSVGLGTTRDDIDYLADALDAVVREGPRWQYRLEEASGEYMPDPETRHWPELPLSLRLPASRGGESS
jgi:selenocysteine lyase/cysteine desulfurase